MSESDGSTRAQVDSELDANERAELERLRRQTAKSARRRRLGWRAPVATVLIVIGCVLAPVSVMGIWVANQVSSTDRYVATVEPLIHQPPVQNALTDKITTAIMSHLNVAGATNTAADALSSQGLTRVSTLLRSFAPSLVSAITGFIHGQVHKIVTGPAIARLWVQTNRIAHTQLVEALSGQNSGNVRVVNGQVTINLGPYIDQVKSNLAARGFTLVRQIPPINPAVALFSARNLTKAQSLYRLVNTLKWFLPFLTLLLLAAGVYIARSHRRALMAAGLGFAASMLVLAAGLTIFRNVYLNSVPSNVLPSDAAAAIYDTMVRFIRQGLRVLLVLGLVVAAAAFFTGPSVTAVRTRGAFVSGLGWLRATGEHAGLRTGPVGEWTYTHRMGLRIGAVGLFALIFVFWGQPTGAVVILLAVLLLVVLGLIELIGRRPAQPEVADSAHTS